MQRKSSSSSSRRSSSDKDDSDSSDQNHNEGYEEGDALKGVYKFKVAKAWLKEQSFCGLFDDHYDIWYHDNYLHADFSDGDLKMNPSFCAQFTLNSAVDAGLQYDHDLRYAYHGIKSFNIEERLENGPDASRYDKFYASIYPQIAEHHSKAIIYTYSGTKYYLQTMILCRVGHGVDTEDLREAMGWRCGCANLNRLVGEHRGRDDPAVYVVEDSDDVQFQALLVRVTTYRKKACRDPTLKEILEAKENSDDDDY
ncbi:hypothetical protein FGO68_gene2553 [Halteria grandinella]|uniref:Uncharacterized protein n=1 Tax=Halteria grandinella TaxID=5974 RepID=A0A8J8NQM7_HALGN|nr:hypothetical protein FGO68_gene2553 [Halteria grandinella]